MDVAAAYQHCEQVTWSQARNFSYGIRLLPPAKRQALAAVYAFARRIDDIGDGTLPPEAKLAALAGARASLAALVTGRDPAAPEAAGGAVAGGAVADGAVADGAVAGGAVADGAVADGAVAGGAVADGAVVDGAVADGAVVDRAVADGAAGGVDPILIALADAAGRFDIPLSAFGELIDGCEADVRGVSYLTFDDLLHYCRCVAGSIGRLSLGVFGTDDVATAAPLADSLGVALQLTNILRDIREDYLGGRVYLPAEDFERFGATLEPGRGDGSGHEKLVELVTFEAGRAREWYTRGLALIPLLDRRSAASAGAMAGIYFRLLEHIAATPALVLSRRVSLSTPEKALVAAKSLTMALLPQAGRRAFPPAAGGAGR